MELEFLKKNPPFSGVFNFNINLNDTFEKNHILRFSGHNGSKMRFCKFYKVTVAYMLKIDINNCFEKNLAMRMQAKRG